VKTRHSARTGSALPLLVAFAAVFALVTATSSDAMAQFTKEQQGCRQAIAKNTTKLAKTIGKVLSGCHKARDLGKESASTNCNDVTAADEKMKVVKAENKFLDKLADPSKGKCVAFAPAELGYYSCPSPCDLVVGAIEDFADVATCVICMAESSVGQMHSDSQGMPSAPMASGDDAKCHAAIGKIQDKHLGTILKDRNGCQKLAEKKDGATDTASCAGSDHKGKINKSRQKSGTKIAKSCAAADLLNLDTCSTTDVNALTACVLDDVDARGEALFQIAYSLGEATWTQVLDVFASNGCADVGCHGGGFVSGGLGSLDDYNAGYTELLTDPVFCAGSSLTSRVVPNDPASSFLVAKLDGSEDCGSPMPLGGLPISDVDLATIVSWIDDGAPQN
jgi:hypothetical protein